MFDDKTKIDMYTVRIFVYIINITPYTSFLESCDILILATFNFSDLYLPEA